MSSKILAASKSDLVDRYNREYIKLSVIPLLQNDVLENEANLGEISAQITDLAAALSACKLRIHEFRHNEVNIHFLKDHSHLISSGFDTFAVLAAGV